VALKGLVDAFETIEMRVRFLPGKNFAFDPKCKKYI